MLRIGLVIATLIALGSPAQAQPASSPATGPKRDPNKVTSTECNRWRQSLSAGRKLSEDDLSRFTFCVEPPSEHGIAPGVETYMPIHIKPNDDHGA